MSVPENVSPEDVSSCECECLWLVVSCSFWLLQIATMLCHRAFALGDAWFILLIQSLFHSSLSHHL